METWEASGAQGSSGRIRPLKVDDQTFLLVWDGGGHGTFTAETKKVLANQDVWSPKPRMAPWENHGRWLFCEPSDKGAWGLRPLGQWESRLMRASGSSIGRSCRFRK